ncbi:MAG: MFS transporter permease [Deltaproteobacteria bacterium]|nr:MFS transporter permease [Deltaproteobacteria bacterium]
MSEKFQEIVIPKEAAVFRLDRNGCWRNKYGKFRRKKIIDFFHSSIKRDGAGYYVTQVRDRIREKVYFEYEDTALFVFDVVPDPDITLVLNTGRRVKLKPKKLLIKGDDLYMNLGEDLVKFVERGLMKISGYLEFDDDTYFIKVGNRRYKICQV